MNASANLRASMIRTSMLPIENSRISTLQQRRHTVQAVNYLEYKAKCDLERDATFVSQFEEYTEEYRSESSKLEQLRCMFTVYPYKDMNWVVAVMFVVGSVTFTINAFFGLLPLLAPSTAFATEVTVALPATITIGALMFLTAGTLGVFAAFNADRGTFEKGDPKMPDGAPAVYRPALVGSSSWVWFPPMADVRALLRTVPFQSGLIQLSGGMILSTAAAAGFPGVLDPNNLFLTQLLIFLPQVIGGSLFLLANIMLAIFIQDRWYKPKLLDANWQGALWNAIASFCFMLTGILLLLTDTLSSALAAFIGSWAFLIGSLIQWYALMEFHVTPWAG